MIIRKLRLQRGWSQDELGRISGLSARTIQRVERGERPSLESAKALAAVFEVPLADLQWDRARDSGPVCAKEGRDDAQTHEVRGFCIHLVIYLLAVCFFFLLNRYYDPGFIWAWWPAMGWSVGLVVHGLGAFRVPRSSELVSR